MAVYRNIIHDSVKEETTQMSNKRRMEKLNVEYSYSVILVSPKIKRLLIQARGVMNLKILC